MCLASAGGAVTPPIASAMGFSSLYDGDIRIPCEVIEKDGLVRCVSFKLKYMPWFAGRSFVKGLKFIMFPKRICKSKAIIEAIISE